MSSVARISGLVLILVGVSCQRDALAPKGGAPVNRSALSALSTTTGHIAFVRILPPSARWVFKMDASGANVTQLANGYVPAWSPDGTKIAFNCGANVCTMNADGSGIVHLTANVLAESPAWSPDGSRIAFDEQDQTGKYHIYVMNADGTGVTELTTGSANDGSPDWSPDGTKIVFARNASGTPQVFVMNADGTNPIQLTSAAGGSRNPAWSPNGSLIAFDSNRSGTNQIYVMNADGSGPAPVPSTAGGSDPDWSLDGSRIVFTCPAGKSTDICAIGPDGSRLVDLTNNRLTENSPAWGP